MDDQIADAVGAVVVDVEHVSKGDGRCGEVRDEVEVVTAVQGG